ncbi:MAG: hypothetical protein GX605_03265, partial [Chloroflexi bacterium]|nr:hypothetical protein [Chloroflexota bacterium]
MYPETAALRLAWPVRLRPMTTDDVPAVEALERATFSMPWSARAFHYDLTRNPDAALSVLETRADVEWRDPVTAHEPPLLVGYGGLWLLVDEGHISTIAVRQGWRGRGLG